MASEFVPLYREAQRVLRRQLAAHRLHPPPGDGLLHRGHDLPRAQRLRLLRRADAVQRHQRAGQHVEDLPPGVPRRQAAGALPAPHAASPLDLRRLRRDHGRRLAAARLWCRAVAGRARVVGRLRVLRARPLRRDVRQPGARARGGVAARRLLRELRTGRGARGRVRPRVRRGDPRGAARRRGAQEEQEEEGQEGRPGAGARAGARRRSRPRPRRARQPPPRRASPRGRGAGAGTRRRARRSGAAAGRCVRSVRARRPPRRPPRRLPPRPRRNARACASCLAARRPAAGAAAHAGRPARAGARSG